MKLAGDRGTPASGGRDQAPEMLATSPIIRQSGRKKAVLARYVHNGRLLDALGGRAFAATTRPPDHPAPAVWATAPPCASSPTARSGSCSAA
jgi:hypothetical protein